MEPRKVLRAGIDLEPLIVQFGTFAEGSSEEPLKVLIYRFSLEPNGFFSTKCIWFLEEPYQLPKVLEGTHVSQIIVSQYTPLFAPRVAYDEKMSQFC